MTSPNNPWNQGGSPQQPYGTPPPGVQPEYGAPPAGSPQPYGAMPPAPGEFLPMTQLRPKSVETSFRLWLLNVGLGAIGTLLTFVFIDDLIKVVAEGQGLSVSAGQIEQARDLVQPVLVTQTMVQLAIAAALVAIAFQMRGAKNWARITLTVLGAIGLIVNLTSIGDNFAIPGVGVLLGVVTVIGLLIALAAIVLMYTKESNEFFRNKQNQYA